MIVDLVGEFCGDPAWRNLSQFNPYLPEGYAIDVPRDDQADYVNINTPMGNFTQTTSLEHPLVDIWDLLRYLDDVKVQFRDDRSVCTAFVELLTRFNAREYVNVCLKQHL